jgi:hypothetical protein
MFGGRRGVRMGNGERSGSGGQRNWPVAVAGGVGGGAGVALSFLVAALADLHGFWLGMIMVGVGAGVGIVLGQFAGRLLFRPSPRNPPDPTSNAEPGAAPDRGGTR